MNSPQTVELTIGNLVYTEHQRTEGLSVVTGLRPLLKIANILEYTGGENGLELGIPGSVRTPVEVVGSITFDETAQSLRKKYHDLSIFEFALQVMKDEVSKDPIEHPRLPSV